MGFAHVLRNISQKGESVSGTDTGRIIAIKHLPKIEIKNTLLLFRF